MASLASLIEDFRNYRGVQDWNIDRQQFNTDRGGISSLVLNLMMKAKGLPESADYDMPGFADSYFSIGPLGVGGISDPNDQGRMHYPDTWKLPNHESFSSESKYGRFTGAPSWERQVFPGNREGWVLKGLNNDVVYYDTPMRQGGIARIIK